MMMVMRRVDDMSEVRAYCPECKKMVSDDLYRTDAGSVNKHEHDVIVLVERGAVPSGGVIAPFMEMTPEAYLTYASQLDAELIVGRIKSKYNIPFGEKIITDIVGLALKSVRELAVEMEEKDRKKASIRKKLEKVNDLRERKQVAEAKKKKPGKVPEEPLT